MELGQLMNEFCNDIPNGSEQTDSNFGSNTRSSEVFTVRATIERPNSIRNNTYTIYATPTTLYGFYGIREFRGLNSQD